MPAQKKTSADTTPAPSSPTPAASPTVAAIPSPSVARFADLPAEWQHYVRAVHVSAHQLCVRLAAIEKSGQISAYAASAYAAWVERVARALALVPIQDDSE